MRYAAILAVTALVAAPASGQSTGRYLVSDPTDVVRVTHCVYTRPSTPAPIVTESPVEVVTGGKRCKFDLVTMNDPRTGTVTVAYKDAVAQEVGPTSSFTFLVPLTAPSNPRLSN